ncbi:hypothetical protein [Halobacillus sp. A5]|uniref:hypothetical protein n=1 Tax=Halobacillus sp. A5 TaxID=2880263 RepID=UPI0020A6684E|nr:hypothetical protein [Halobacillus sp. A5]MCP3027634.1 hypothetical protein [Halobacillus sp. A5]
MNYEKELEAFFDQKDIDQLSVSSIALWFTLMQFNSRTGWKKEMTLPTSPLLLKSGRTEGSFMRARRKLVDKGYVIYRKAEGRKGSPCYEKISLVR